MLLFCGSCVPSIDVEHVFALGELFEHLDELFERDLAIIVDVDLRDDFLPDALGVSYVVAHDGRDFVSVDMATSVFVEKLESGAQVWLVQQLLLVDGSRAPLAKVNRTTAVHIRVFEDPFSAFVHFLPVLVRVEDAVGSLELILLDNTVSIGIELIESVAHGSLLLLRGQVARHVGQRSLL